MVGTENYDEQIGHGNSLEISIARFIESFEIERPDPILNMKGLAEGDGFSKDYWRDKGRRFGELRDEYLAWERASGLVGAQAVHTQQPPTGDAAAFVAAAETLLEAVREGLEQLNRTA